MLSVRPFRFAVTPFQNCVLYSTSKRPSKKKLAAKYKAQPEKKFSFRPDRFGPNPGVQLQWQELGLSERELTGSGLENLESQFFNVDNFVDTIAKEEYVNKHVETINQIMRKQFKAEKSPNMLLWDEKQKIKALHAEDPEKWTFWKLAFSYPASPSIIEKVIKAKYQKTFEQIEEHDRQVRSNWQDLYKGKLENVDDNLKKHFLTFTDRRKVLTQNSKEITTEMVNSDNTNPLQNVLKDGGVFANIFKSYKQLKEPETVSASAVKQEESSAKEGLRLLEHQPMDDTYIVPISVQGASFRTTKPFTLEEMKDRVFVDYKSGKTLADDEKNFVRDRIPQKMEESTNTKLRDPIGNTMNVPIKNSSSNESIDHGSSTVSEIETTFKFVDVSKLEATQEQEDRELLASFKTAKLQRSETDSENMVKAVKSFMSSSTESFPLQIAVPKHLWKKGALYRVKDRFYADDGEFLFRVPGLSKE